MDIMPVNGKIAYRLSQTY